MIPVSFGAFECSNPPKDQNQINNAGDLDIQTDFKATRLWGLALLLFGFR